MLGEEISEVKEAKSANPSRGLDFIDQSAANIFQQSASGVSKDFESRFDPSRERRSVVATSPANKLLVEQEASQESANFHSYI